MDLGKGLLPFDFSDTLHLKEALVFMDIPQKLGIIIFSGVPAIMGGGIVYALFGHATLPVVIYELLLMAGVFSILRKK